MMNKEVVKQLLKSFVVISAAGVVIGLLRHHDALVAVLLALFALERLWRTLKVLEYPYAFMLLLAGMILTGCAGVYGEEWGIANGYWAYHDLPDNREFPYWLPFAWALAFLYLYRVELAIIKNLHLRSFRSKILIIAAVSSSLNSSVYLR